MLTKLGAIALAMMLVIGRAEAADFKPAVIFDIGGKFDKSFNEAAYHGAERFKKETGIPYLEFEVTQEAQRSQAMERLVRKGASIIVVVGYAFSTPLERIAKADPETKFTLIDDAVDAPNVQSVTFKAEQGSFLVGMAAAMASKTGKVGFVGGMDIPLIRNFQVGYEQGVKHVDPKDEVIVNYAGTTSAAWTDPARGAELTVGQFDRGADVVYAAAGQTGLGVLQAAADKDKLAIGVDSNQDYLHPGHVLTSMLKRVDVAVYSAFKTAHDGTWKAGEQDLGLKADGVDWAQDQYNAKLITPEMAKKINAAKEEIIAGKITVKPYGS